MEGIMVPVEDKPVQPPGSLHFVLVFKTPMKHNPTPKIYQTALNIQGFFCSVFNIPSKAESPRGL